MEKGNNKIRKDFKYMLGYLSRLFKLKEYYFSTGVKPRKFKEPHNRERMNRLKYKLRQRRLHNAK